VLLLLLQVLRHVASSLQAYMQPAAAAQQQQQDAAKQASSSSSSSSSSNAGIIRAHGLAAAAAPAANLSTATADRAALAAAEASTSSSTSDGSSAQAPGSAAASSPAAPRVMLLCGADLLATINTPGVWQDPDIILQEHGIVCVCRAGTDVDALLQEPGSVLQRHRQHVVVVQEPVANDVSSTMVRQLLAAGQPVRYLVPDAVLAYIEQHQLFAGEGCAMMR
jgi:nicotinate (nicotinamide) nucleotide adenylyltransferase